MQTGLAVHLVRTIQLGHIPVDCLVDLAKPPAQLLARKALRLGVDEFELAAVDGDDPGIQKIDASAEGDGWAFSHTLSALQTLGRTLRRCRSHAAKLAT
jgi:hypothetical protein